jgi:hypothetical protein
MKILSLAVITISLLLGACNNQAQNTHTLQMQIDSLKTQLAQTYTPGFGEFMGNIQTHHAKLWFAGQHENWKLADFELQEMLENIENIRHYQQARKETIMLTIIDKPLKDINIAITSHNKQDFNTCYTTLTQTCNNCHESTGFAFNKIIIPKEQYFSNQDFSVHGQ